MNGCEKGIIPIRKVLEIKQKDIHAETIVIWNKAHELQERQRSKEEHQQGYLHCKKVEENLGKIISDDDKCNRFTPLELFLLSVAACYHDAGKSDDFNEGHALVVMKDIYLNPEKYHVSDSEGKVLSYIIGSHDSDEIFDDTPQTYPIGNEDVCVKILSALFKLADVLHTDNSRIPHIIVGDAEKKDEKTRFRKLVSGWSNNEESQIILKATPENINDVNIIAKGVSMMQKQIECIAPVLQSEGYPYEIICSYDNRGIKWVEEKESKRKFLEMDFYTEDEEYIFKGRDVESERLLRKVIGKNIFLLIGTSGVGKTSLIRAGLFPKLKKMGWKCIWTRPVYSDKRDRILDDINVQLPDGFESKNILSCITKLSIEIKSDIIIVIDQFEDALRLPQPVKDELRIILLRIYAKSFRNIYILLSYRSDYGSCPRFTEPEL